MATFDDTRYAAEVEAAYGFLHAFMESEVRFYRSEDEHENGTPTAADILRGLVGTLTDNLDPEHAAGESTLPELVKAAGAEYAALHGPVWCGMTTHFIVFDRDTGATLATLPLTIPIGETVEAFHRAGQDVGWRWAK